MPTLKITIGGMHGRDDEERVQALLRGRSGVYGAIADHGKGCVEVDFEDDEESVEQILALLESAGFEAQLSG